MKRNIQRLSTLAALALGAVFLVSGYQVLRGTAGIKSDARAFEALAKITKPEQAPGRDDSAGARPEHTETASRYAVYKELNADYFGWISIADTALDYPVMYTPERPEYYLRRNFDGEYSVSGVPFLSEDCAEDCGNYIIYGHNMKNGSMFASLLSYAEREYWEQHPVICFEGKDGCGEYEVMAAFYAQAYPVDAENVFRFYRYTDVRDPGVFEEYLAQVAGAALYETGIKADYGDQLLTLSTCSYHIKDGRFVVVARKSGG